MKKKVHVTVIVPKRKMERVFVTLLPQESKPLTLSVTLKNQGTAKKLKR